jgi:uncharacterized membrane protein
MVRTNVIAGILLLLPLITTTYVLVKLFALVDSVLPSLFHAILPTIMPETWPTGVGVVLTLLVAYFAGLAAKNYIGKLFINAGNTIIARIPIINKIYLSVQQIVDAVVSNNKRLFERAVLIEYPKANSYCIGFVTSRTSGEIPQKVKARSVSVFVPTTPNPTSGFLLFLPETEVIDLDMSVEMAIKLVMSAGTVNPDQLRKTQHLYAMPASLKGWNLLRSFKRRSPQRSTAPSGEQ